MVKKIRFNHYEYPLKDSKGNTYYGEYTIREGVKPLGYKGEKLTQSVRVAVKYNPA